MKNNSNIFISDFDSVNTKTENDLKQLLSDKRASNTNFKNPFNDINEGRFLDDLSLLNMMDDSRMSNSNVSVKREKRFARSGLEDEKNVEEFVVDEPFALPLRPIIRGPFDGDEQTLEEVSVIYVEPRTQVKLNCEVNIFIFTYYLIYVLK